MQGLEDHYFRFTSDELFNGLPAQLVDKWSAWGIKAAVGYNSCSSILKFLQLRVVNFLFCLRDFPLNPQSVHSV